jgi:hypothetical protein
LLDAVNLYIQPVVNPDGYAADTRYDSHGIDLNRDYPYPDEGKGFTEPETRLVDKLLHSVPFDGAIAFHSGMEGVLWPWGYTNERNLREPLFKTLSALTAQSMGFSYFAQSIDSYPSTGEFIDYAYGKYGTLALTVEVSRKRTPSPTELAEVVKRSVEGTLTFIDHIAKLTETTLASEP